MKHLLAAGAVALTLTSNAEAQTLVSFGGFGNAVTIGSQQFPWAKITAVPSAVSGVAQGIIQIVPGTYSPMIYEQRGVVDFIPQGYNTPGKNEPLCMYQFDYGVLMAAGVVSAQNIAQYQNIFARVPYKDGNGYWHENTYMTFEFDLNQVSSQNETPWQINYRCE